MKVFFDARWTRLDTHDGISRYGANLVTALAKIHPVTMIIYDKRQLNLLPKDVNYVKLNHPFSLSELWMGPKLNKLGADVVYSPLQTMGSWGRHYKLILTLQDLTYYKFAKPPSHLPAVVRFIWWLFHKAYWPQKLLLSAANHIATVSETAKQEIQAAHLTKLPISVIYNAPPILTTKKLQNKPGPSLVYMGSLMPYKNVEMLMQAMSQLPGYTLHLTSRSTPEREAELLKMTADPGRIKFWRGTSDEQYAEVLSKARASVTVSKAEGFGLQIIEGMNQGVPVICTDMPIFHEVGGDAALYVDPNNPDKFVQQVKRLEDPTFYAERAAKSLQQAAKFSWANSAKALLQVMQQVVAQPSHIKRP
jgi:glycosyltransferase involved in cell wall biosynthesis